MLLSIGAKDKCKGTIYYPIEMQENVKWMDDEVYALVLFIKILHIRMGKVGHHTKI